LNRSRWSVLALLAATLIALPSCGGHNSVTINATPVLSSVFPAVVTAGSQTFTVFLSGTNFQSGTGSSSFVFWNGTALSTIFNPVTTQLQATVPASFVVSPGVAQITVMNPGLVGGQSNAVTFTIEPVQAATPMISSISPSATGAGSPAFTLMVNGSGFTTNDVVTWNGEFRTTTFVSAAKLTAQISNVDVGAVGTAAVSVLDTVSGILSAPTVTFTITGGNNPAPGPLAFSPSSAVAGGPGFELVIGGSNFVSGISATFNGVPLAVDILSSTELDAWVSAADIATGGMATIAVTNPAPGGGTSSAQYPIKNLIPTISALSPTSITAGSQSFFLTITGTNFISGANGVTFAFWNGSPRNTTFNLVTQQLSVLILASDVATAGIAQITVANPGPGGGASAPSPFTISALQAGGPVITSLLPPNAFAGSTSFTLTVDGTGFVSADTVTWNNQPRTTTFVTANQLTAQINSVDVEFPGFATVAVMPTSGASSASVDFTIVGPNNLVPGLTSISPTTTSPGGPAFELTVNGSLFVPTSAVMWSSTPLATSFINSGQFVAWVPASLITSTANVDITVFNPGPGGGTSSFAVFKIQ